MLVTLRTTIFALCLLLNPWAGCSQTAKSASADHDRTAEGSVEPGEHDPAEENLPRVLIIGDSISIGYTPFVREMLEGEAIIQRPMLTPTLTENAEGTVKGLRMIDRWIGNEPWDVIHFNFGLHDLKFVDERGRNSTSPDDQRQTSIDAYESNLRAIVDRLRKTGAELIFATTTPVPAQTTGPLRLPEDVPRYNEAALRVMREHDVRINDLYAAVLPKQDQWRRPRNVHFHETGYRMLAKQVAREIRAALRRRAAADSND